MAYCYHAYKNLSSVPDLPVNAGDVDLRYNQIVKLIKMPKNMTRLMVSKNPLVSLDGLNESLMDLCCNECELTDIKSLPQQLLTLDCRNNLLSYLPQFNQSLELISCYGNPLKTQLIRVNDKLKTFWINQDGRNTVKGVLYLLHDGELYLFVNKDLRRFMDGYKQVYIFGEHFYKSTGQPKKQFINDYRKELMKEIVQAKRQLIKLKQVSKNGLNGLNDLNGLNGPDGL